MRGSWAALSLTFTALAVVRAADSSTPHPHEGKLEPFRHGAPNDLTAAEKASVDAGNPVQKTVQFDEGVGARAVAVFHVDAPPDVVWSCITDIRQYPRMVPGVAETSVYGTSKTRSGGQHTLVKYTLALLGYRMTYFLDIWYEPKQNSMTFRMDYTRLSDLDDTIGYWHVEPTDTGSRVTYSAALILRGWWPKPVVNMLLSTSLGRATSWVGIEAAKRLTASGGATGSATTGCKWSWRKFRRVCPPPPPPPPPPTSTNTEVYGIAIGLSLVLVLVSAAMYGCRPSRASKAA
mmetsp:Transcript_35550/g.74663  ORF Transcript_35550/g.74663 Transcript_35550/m.74663 type:complete len:291 (+) Transcript_35550:83-955(+)|eukprot:6198753-Pleurochrysis_carterae.AAC.3